MCFKSWALGALGGLPRDSLGGLVGMMPCWVKYTRAPPRPRDPCGATDLGRHSVHTRWAVPGCTELTSMVPPPLLRFPTRLLGVVGPRISLLRGPFPPYRIATPLGPPISEGWWLEEWVCRCIKSFLFLCIPAARRLWVGGGVGLGDWWGYSGGGCAGAGHHLPALEAWRAAGGGGTPTCLSRGRGRRPLVAG